MVCCKERSNHLVLCYNLTSFDQLYTIKCGHDLVSVLLVALLSWPSFFTPKVFLFTEFKFGH